MVENPPAFPWLDTIHATNGGSGMTLRDWFAGQALAGVVRFAEGGNVRTGETPAEADARWAYERADALLAERQKGGDA